MDVLEYQRQFDSKKEALKIPPDCTEINDPVFNATFSHTWWFEWYLVFDDKKYVRLWELFERRKGLYGGWRTQFAFHYGPIVSIKPDGTPERNSNDPVDIRFDTDRGSPHMHYKAQDPHLYQDNVDGIDLGKIDMFDFLKGIIKHRKTGKEIDKVFGFKIK